MHLTTLGIDVAMSVCQLHGVEARGRAGRSRRVTRPQGLDTVATRPACVIGRETCGRAQPWGRAFEPLGRPVTLMPPPSGTPSVQTNTGGLDARSPVLTWCIA